MIISPSNDSSTTRVPIDLHCHSTNSDGSLSVVELLNLAKENGGKYLALTDHDTVEGIPEAKTYASEIGLTLIGGVEISVSWRNNTLIHVLGLNIDENNTNLQQNLYSLRQLRFARGEKIAEKLEKIGIKNALDGALAYCQKPEALSRTHFARFLVANGYAKPGRVFDKYLAQGRSGYVPQIWASLESAVSWITQSGGIAVIAHPGRYKLTNTKLLELIHEFKSYGGMGIEVNSSSHSKEEAAKIASIAHNHNLLASNGSDFHTLNNGYKQIILGTNLPLPSICQPIYAHLGIDYHG